MAAARLTDVPGSSQYFRGAIVAYANEIKIDVLGVPADLIAAHGAVSEPVAAAMAQGARTRLGVDIAAAVTGIAGPDGGTETKPVGTVCFSVSGPGKNAATVTRVVPGDRQLIRQWAVMVMLDLVRRAVR
jgi:nicotinamide-nucleotide amidase